MGVTTTTVRKKRRGQRGKVQRVGAAFWGLDCAQFIVWIKGAGAGVGSQEQAGSSGATWRPWNQEKEAAAAFGLKLLYASSCCSCYDYNNWEPTNANFWHKCLIWILIRKFTYTHTHTPRETHTYYKAIQDGAENPIRGRSKLGESTQNRKLKANERKGNNGK